MTDASLLPDSFDVPRQLPKSSFVSRLLASGPGLLDLTEHCLVLTSVHQQNLFIKLFGIGILLGSLFDHRANKFLRVYCVSTLTQLVVLFLPL